jgi:hypothetical protein
LHDAVYGPPAQAEISVSRFAFVHTPCVAGTIGSEVLDEQEPYGAGHVVCWLLQRRGETSPLQNEPDTRQLAHAPPPSPHELLLLPSGSHLPSPRQQPAQLPGPHFGVVHTPD